MPQVCPVGAIIVWNLLQILNMLIDSSTLVLGLLALTIGFLTRTILRRRSFPCAPGPLLARFTNFWQATEMAKGHFQTTNIQLHQTQGMLSY